MFGGIIIAVIGNLFIGASLVFDKIFLKDKVSGNVLNYVFWIGLLNGFGLLLLPFGFHAPTLAILTRSLLAGAIFIAGLSFYYLALKKGEASQSLAIIGGFSPVATFLIGNLFLGASLNIAEKIAFGVLAAGGFLLFASEKISFRKILPLVVLAAIFAGISRVAEKSVFDASDFITGFVTIKIFTLLAALALLLSKRARAVIFTATKAAAPKHKILYLGNRFLAGLGSFSIFYAIKLNNPAIVEAIGGIRYVVIFLLALALTRFRPQWLSEKFRGWALAGKIIATFFILIGLLGLGLQTYYKSKPLIPPSQISWGVTFSAYESSLLGLDWRENYGAIISDLRPKMLRLIAYWQYLEPKPDEWDFKDLDYQMEQAKIAGIPVTLAIGQKVPRWPECHYPEWLNQNDTQGRQQELLKYIAAVVSRYRNGPELKMWQVENEPFLNFGICPPNDAQLLTKEITLVKSLDPAHPVLTTDGGEYGDWARAASRGDIFGTTMYRKVHIKVLGYITYPLTPQFFQLKKSLVQLITGKPNQRFIVSELGLEPWDEKQLYEISVAQQLSRFNIDDFKSVIAYAKEARFDTYYMWGAEWWYWMKARQNDPRFWDTAKEIFKR